MNNPFLWHYRVSIPATLPYQLAWAKWVEVGNAWKVRYTSIPANSCELFSVYVVVGTRCSQHRRGKWTALSRSIVANILILMEAIVETHAMSSTVWYVASPTIFVSPVLFLKPRLLHRIFLGRLNKSFFTVPPMHSLYSYCCNPCRTVIFSPKSCHSSDCYGKVTLAR